MSDLIAGSSSDNPVISDDNSEKLNEIIDPEVKKIKLSLNVGKSEKLEQRLEGILCCVVCLDLPVAAVYQVKQVISF